MNCLAEIVAKQSFVLLDGGLGTEMEARGENICMQAQERDLLLTPG
jgi:S-methylmethionine-dependent homocysteine/selenocysteine methylase